MQILVVMGAANQNIAKYHFTPTKITIIKEKGHSKNR
jgi:hypothetical protein